MIVFLNGRFIPEERAFISIHDRGFLYGDGLFETMRVYHGEPFLWREHMARFLAGCELLQIAPPLSPGELRCAVAAVLRKNALTEAVVRITLSRGAGKRGYSPQGADHPSLLVAAFQIPPQEKTSFRLKISTVRLPGEDSLARAKHLNKLRQVLARAEADAVGCDEALLLNGRGEVMEGSSSNIFWIRGGSLGTPPPEGILPGATRGYVLEMARALGLPVREERIEMAALLKAEGICVTSSAIELMEVSEVDGIPVPRSPILQRLKAAYRARPN